MRHRGLYIFLFLASLYWVSSVCAQPPNPPPGWQYVFNLDSLTVDHFHPWNDTIFMNGRDVHSSINSNYFVVSYNGGKDWDSVIFPEVVANGGYRFYFNPYGPEIVFLYKDSTLRFYISRDGKKYEKIEVGKDTSNAIGDNVDNLYIDPHNFNHWLFVTDHSGIAVTNSWLIQSFDGGHSWKQVQVPLLPGRERYYYELVFDSRREGVWYVHVTEIAHHTEPELDTNFAVRTTDNGESFEWIRQWGTHYGIGKIGEVRRWWGYSNQSIYGPMIGNDDDDTLVKINWLSLFHPSYSLVNYSIGYWRGITNQSEQFYGQSHLYTIYYPTNFLVFNSDPNHSIVVETEYKTEPSSDKSEYTHSWIHQTEDNWNTWSTIWESGQFEWADQTFLEEKTPSLYVISKFLTDTAQAGYSPDRYTSYLYKRNIKLSVNSNNLSHVDSLTIFPSPARNKVYVKLTSSAKKIISVKLFDITGRTLFRKTEDFLFSQNILELPIPDLAPSGCYLLQIQTDNTIYPVKVILER